jgi:hypothetical protein
LTLNSVGWQGIIFSTFSQDSIRRLPMNSTAANSSTDHRNATRAEDFDILILGGGTGSTVAAWTFAKEGKRVAVVDRKYIGGSCPNIACLPSKNIIHSAQVANYVRHSEEYGVTHGDMRIDMSVVRGRKRAMVSGLNAAYLGNYQATGAEFILGSGRFVAPKTLEVTLADGSKRWLRGANVHARDDRADPRPDRSPTADAYRSPGTRRRTRSPARHWRGIYRNRIVAGDAPLWQQSDDDRAQ